MSPSLRRLVPVLGLVFLLVLIGVTAQDFGKLQERNHLTAFKRGWKEQHPLRHRGLHRNGMLGDYSKRYTGHEHSKMKRRHGGKITPSYFVIAPTVVRPASVYRVVVGVLQGNERHTGQIEVRAALSTVHDRQMAQAHHYMRFGETKALIMKAPENIGAASGSGGLRLKVEGRLGSQVLFSNVTHVAATTRFLTMLVQMSRPIYTGSQRIEFRVVLLRTDMRPYQGPVHVYVLDTDGYVVKRWLSRFPSTGVVELKMGTAGLPKPGWWRVKVVAGNQVHYHPFYITKYFPPRFEVLVEAPFFTVADEGAIAGRFGAFFLTYMPVEGSANVTVYLKEHWKLPDSSYKKVVVDSVGFVST